ncbi:MAG: hypothetical protein JXA25_17170 [Anaerolineales bacterium]|nr:hypothetical protein [Anaerolineales bacterium]
MSSQNAVALVLLLLFIGLMVFYTVMRRRWPANFRSIRPFERLGSAIEQSVETGERIHLSLGTASIDGPHFAPALVGLSILEKIISAAAISDRPTVVTTADGSIMILAQDTLKRSYARVRASGRYENSAARLLGATPFSYIASIPSFLKDEEISVHILNGSFGTEGGLATAFAEDRDLFVLAGTDDLQIQALMYATSNTTLIGEEVFAGGAYLHVNPMHRASLQTEDLIRWILILAVVAGTVLVTIGVQW